MALQTSGIITLQDIHGEFGGPSSPVALQNYYRGGGLVPDTTTNAGVPTTGVIGIQDFYGAENLSAVLNNVAADGNTFTWKPRYEIQNDGNVYASVGSEIQELQHAWLVSGAASDFEVRMDVVSGSIGGSATGTWLNAGTNRLWSYQSDSTGNAEGTIRVRPAGSTEMDSATVTFQYT